MPRELRPTMQDLDLLVAQLCQESALIEARLKNIILERLLREAEAKQGAPAPQGGNSVEVDFGPVDEAMQAAWERD